jgi:hypothetical protein
MNKIYFYTLLLIAAAGCLIIGYAEVSVDCEMALAFLSTCSFACAVMLAVSTFRFRVKGVHSHHKI